jgi:lipoprotein-anchoring transpeptidase ErfK/SrfK
VRIIQGALNRVADADNQNPRFMTNGEVTPTMLEVIRRLQRFGLGMSSPDGKVDPGGKTFKMLAHSLKQKRIMVSLKEQYLEAYDDGRRIHRFACMTGASDSPTDPGVFKIFNKDEKHRSRKYNADMHYAMFFTKDGKAVHQYHGPFSLTRFMKGMSDWFGSHGCVRLEESNARTLFGWTPNGTVVEVY